MNKKLKKTLKILKGIVTGFLLVVLIVILVQRISNNNLAIGGIRIFTIISESMKPDYLIGDILISKKTDPANIKVGDRVTYLGKEGDLKDLVITHEVIEKSSKDNKYYFVTKGTNNEYIDPEVSEDDIYGKVIYKTVVFGFFGRLMSNIIIYYVVFVIVGLLVSYEVITSFTGKDKEGEIKNEEIGNDKESS